MASSGVILHLSRHPWPTPASHSTLLNLCYRLLQPTKDINAGHDSQPDKFQSTGKTDSPKQSNLFIGVLN